MAQAPPTPDLLDARFIERAKALRIIARRVAPGGRWADQRSLDRGAGIEFRDYRGYAPGDELRTVDWNIYRRLGRIVVRLFEEMEDLPVYLLPDFSGSMWHDSPPRAFAAMRAVVALAAIGLDQHDAVGLMPFDERLDVRSRARSGRGRLLEIAATLNAHAAATGASGKQTNLCAALNHFHSLRQREGLLVIASDFFDPAGADAIVKELKRMRHRIMLLPITRTGDRTPDLQGDVRVRDCEGGPSYDVSVTTEVRDRYQEAYDRHMGVLEQFSRSRRGGFLPLDADTDILDQFAKLFEGGSYTP